MLQPRRNTVFIYSQEAADRILDRSTRQRDTGTSHVTGKTNQRVLAAVCICMKSEQSEQSSPSSLQHA